MFPDRVSPSGVPEPSEILRWFGADPPAPNLGLQLFFITREDEGALELSSNADADQSSFIWFPESATIGRLFVRQIWTGIGTPTADELFARLVQSTDQGATYTPIPFAGGGTDIAIPPGDAAVTVAATYGVFVPPNVLIAAQLGLNNYDADGNEILWDFVLEVL